MPVTIAVRSLWSSEPRDELVPIKTLYALADDNSPTIRRLGQEPRVRGSWSQRRRARALARVTPMSSELGEGGVVLVLIVEDQTDLAQHLQPLTFFAYVLVPVPGSSARAFLDINSRVNDYGRTTSKGGWVVKDACDTAESTR